MVYLLALVTALVNAVASILQRLGVEGSPSGRGGELVTHAVAQRTWQFGFVLMAGGFAAQAAALHLGSLTVVQPLLVTELVFVVRALGLWFGARLRARDVAASIAAAAGLAGFLAAAATKAGTAVPDRDTWVVVGAVTALAVAALVVAGARGPAWWRALALGAAASVGFSLTAAITKVTTDRLVAGWASLFGSWPLWTLAVVGLSSFFLMQRAFHAGPFTASQATLILVNPFASIGLGVVLFHDRLATTPGALAIETASLVVTVTAILVLVTSPLVSGQVAGDERQLLVGRGWLARRRARG